MFYILKHPWPPPALVNLQNGRIGWLRSNRGQLDCRRQSQHQEKLRRHITVFLNIITVIVAYCGKYSHSDIHIQILKLKKNITDVFRSVDNYQSIKYHFSLQDFSLDVGNNHRPVNGFFREFRNNWHWPPAKIPATVISVMSVIFSCVFGKIPDILNNAEYSKDSFLNIPGLTLRNTSPSKNGPMRWKSLQTLWNPSNVCRKFRARCKISRARSDSLCRP